MLPFRRHVPSGRLSGPTLNPPRCFLVSLMGASSSRARLGAMVAWYVGFEIFAVKFVEISKMHFSTEKRLVSADST